MTTTPEKTVAPAAADLVNLTIDDVEVAVPKGTLIIRAAETVGIEIPRFCDHPGLDPVGACRQCLVEVWMPGPPGPDGTPSEPRQMQGPPGRMKPQASCTMTVAPGMVVKTQYTSEGADKAQQGVMELLLINHPLDCPVCDKGGECPLQNQAMSNGRSTSRFEDVKRTYPKPVKISSQVLLDRERCVLCARCTRFSEQIAGDPFIALVERGALQQVGIYEEKPFESYFSGNTVQICPVGALTGSAYRFRSRPFDLVSTPSVCEHCASGCAQRTDHRRGSVLRRMAQNDPAVNEEWNCDKGRWAFAYTSARRPPRAPARPWRRRRAARRVVARGPRGRRHRPARRVLARGPHRRSGQRRGRLRLRQVRPHRARHQRRRLPRPAALGRGGRLPRLPRRRHRAPRAWGGHLRRPRGRQGRPPRRLRARGREPHRLPPAAQGVPHATGPASSPSRPSPPAAWRRWAARSSPRRPAPSPRCCAPSARRPAPTPSPPRARPCARAPSSSSASASPPSPARSAPSPPSPRPPGPASPGSRAGRGSAVPSRPARCPPSSPEADRSPTPAPAPRSPPAWGVQTLPEAPGRDTAAIVAAAVAGDVDALVVGGVDPADLGLAGCRRGARLDLRRVPRDPPVGGHRGRRRRPARRRARREGRHVRRLGGSRPPLRGRPRHRLRQRLPRPRHARRRARRVPRHAHPARGPLRDGRARPVVRRPRRRPDRRGRRGAEPRARHPRPRDVAPPARPRQPPGRRAVPRGHRAPPGGPRLGRHRAGRRRRRRRRRSR